MTQEPVRRPSSTHRRSARVPRNRPVLVTSTENEGNEQNEQVGEDTSPTLEESLAEVQAQNPAVAAASRWHCLHRTPSADSSCEDSKHRIY